MMLGRTRTGSSSSRSTRSRPLWQQWLMGSSLWFACLVLTDYGNPVSATVTVENEYFPSMPAVFGKTWRLLETYPAHLQFLEDDPFLCQGHESVILAATTNQRKERSLHRVDQDNHTLVLPVDGIPIVLLAGRGGCSFEEKARTAMTYPQVQYVLVFDDRVRSQLVPMSATDSAGITVGMLFISHATGLQLREVIAEQSANTTEQGGTIVLLDAHAPILPVGPTYDETQQWMLAAMAGFFTFLACFGCLLVCIQAGYIPADGRVVLGRLPVPPGSHRPLLSEAQVLKLPQEIYHLPEKESLQYQQQQQKHASCAICIEEYQEGETVRVLPCDHIFHTECIVPWLTERHPSCPLCKFEIVAPPEMDHPEGGGGRWWFLGFHRREAVPTDEELDLETNSPPNNSVSSHSLESAPRLPTITVAADITNIVSEVVSIPEMVSTESA